MPEELKKADPSQYMEGTVASITDFGAFITVCVWCVYGVCVCVCVCASAHVCVRPALLQKRKAQLRYAYASSVRKPSDARLG